MTSCITYMSKAQSWIIGIVTGNKHSDFKQFLKQKYIVEVIHTTWSIQTM